MICVLALYMVDWIVGVNIYGSHTRPDQQAHAENIIISLDNLFNALSGLALECSVGKGSIQIFQQQVFI